MRGECALVAACVMLVACSPKAPLAQQSDAPVVNAAAQAHADALARADITRFIALQNDRAARLETFESRAAIELRYSDDSGAHTDACEGDIFLTTLNRGALRLTKLGSNLMWIGGDGTRAWIFRIDTKPTTATVYEGLSGGVQLDGSQVVGTGEFMLLSPASVRVLLGFALVPADASIVAIANIAPDAASHLRFEVHFSPAKSLIAAMRFSESGFPTEITVRLDSGTEVARATLTEPVRAQAANIAQGAWPLVARRIEVLAARSASQVRIYLDEPHSDGKRMKQKFFDLDALIAQLRPDSTQFIHPLGSVHKD